MADVRVKMEISIQASKTSKTFVHVERIDNDKVALRIGQQVLVMTNDDAATVRDALDFYVNNRDATALRQPDPTQDTHSAFDGE